MAQLKDTVVLGSLRVTDSIYSNSVQLSTLLAPTASDGSTYGTGTNEYVLMSNGTSVYWGAGVSNAIKALDVNTIGNANGTKYIAAISQTDGKIAATAIDVATTYSATGTTAVSGKSIAAALDTLDFSSIGVAAATGNRFVSQISQTDGKISAVLGAATIGSSKLPVYISAGTITAVTAKDTANNLINALDTGSSNLTANDYVITQYVGGGTTTTTYHRRPANAIRVGGLLTARKLKVDLSSTTDVTFDGTADKTNIPISNTLGVANGGTGNNANYTQWGIVYASTTTKLVNTAAGATDTALMGKGSAAPAFVAVSTTLATSTAATASAGQKLKVTVLGVASSEIELSKATTGLYGVTKLTDSYTSTDGTLATTGKALLAAIQTLDVSAVGGGTGEYINKISETDGKISATKSTTSVSNVWTDGTTTGPTITTTVNGINGTAVAIPAATASKSGVVTIDDQTFNGNKTFNDNVTAKEFIGKLKGQNIIPTLSKVYESTSFYGSANTDASCCYYMASIKPDSFYKPWSVRFRVRSFCPGHTNVDSVTYGLLTGRNTGSAYANWNERYNHAHYYTTFHPLTQAGFDAGYAHAFGVNIVSSTNRTTAGYYRTFEIDIYSYEGCTVELLDAPVLWANWPNNSTTNYTTLVNCNAVDRGLQETGDANQTWASDLYINNGNWKAVNQVYRYYILFEQRPGYLVSVSGNNNAAGTTNKTMLDEPFDAFGQIFYYNTTSAVAPAANVDAGSLMYAALADMRYSFNIVNTTGSTAPIQLIAHNPVYLKVLPLGGKMVKIDNDHPLTMEEAATDDGYWYIYLGQAYDWYRVRLINYHPVYHFKNGTWSLVVPPVEKVNLTTTLNAVAYYVDATGTFGTKASANGALYATSTNGSLQWGTLPVAQGGTGATSFTANSVIISGNTTTAALTTRSIYTRSAVGTLDWASTSNEYILTKGAIAYWNGAYSGTSSNLAYCAKGAFGTIVTTNYPTSNKTAVFLRGDGSWSNTLNGATFKITNNSNTVTIGSQNSNYCHFTNSQSVPFYFSNTIQANGQFTIYNTTTYLANGILKLSGITTATMNASSGNPRIVFMERDSNGTESEPVYLMYTDYNAYRSPAGLKVLGNQAIPVWFEVEGGLYFAQGRAGFTPSTSGVERITSTGHNAFEFSGNATATERQWQASVIIRECNYVGDSQSVWNYAPRLAFLWNARGSCCIELHSNNGMYFMAAPQSDGTRAQVYAAGFNSGSGNDYAEERDSLVLQPGKVVTETTVGKMILADERLLPACRVVSDTYGMSVGQRDSNEFRAPIAVSGRVLVYPYRDRTEYPLGAAVCSAPNGTVDIMTREEIMMYPERIIGTVSEIPTYELWSGSGIMGDIDSNVIVDGRIWVYVR